MDDEEIKNRVVLELKDRQINWWAHGRNQPELHEAVQSASVALLLLSAPLIESSYFRNQLKPLLSEALSSGLPIVTIVARDCLWQRDPWLRTLQIWRGEFRFPREKAAQRKAIQELVDHMVPARQTAEVVSPSRPDPAGVSALPGLGVAVRRAPAVADFRIIYAEGGRLTADWVADTLRAESRTVVLSPQGFEEGAAEIVVVSRDTPRSGTTTLLGSRTGPVLAILAEDGATADWLGPATQIAFAGRTAEEKKRDLLSAISGNLAENRRADVFILHSTENSRTARFVEGVMWNGPPRKTCVYRGGSFGLTTETELLAAALRARRIVVIHSDDWRLGGSGDLPRGYASSSWFEILDRKRTVVIKLDDAALPNRLPHAKVIEAKSTQEALAKAVLRETESPAQKAWILLLGILRIPTSLAAWLLGHGIDFCRRHPAVAVVAAILILFGIAAFPGGGARDFFGGEVTRVAKAVNGTGTAIRDRSVAASDWLLSRERFRVEAGGLFSGFAGPGGQILTLEPSNGSVRIDGYRILIASLAKPNGAFAATLTFRKQVSLLFRAQLDMSSYYEARLNQRNDRLAAVVFRHQGQQQTLIKLDSSEEIDFKPGGKVGVSVSAKGPYFTIAVNGIRVARCTDSSLTTGGFGLLGDPTSNVQMEEYTHQRASYSASGTPLLALLAR